MSRTRNRLVIIGIALLFFGPLLLAVLMQSKWWQYEPAGHTNRGDLIEPPVPLPADALEWSEPPGGRWLILYLAPTDCGRSCDNEAAGLRRVHIAAGRHQEQLAVGLLPTSSFTALPEDRWLGIYDQFLLGRDATGAGLKALATAAGSSAPAALDRRAFLLDPTGHIILAYPAGFDPGDINRDLERLLKWSAREPAE